MWHSPYGYPGMSGYPGCPPLHNERPLAWVPQCAVPMGPMTYGNYHTAPSQYLSMAMGSNAALQEEGVKSYIQWFTNDDQTRDLAHPGDIQNIVSLAKDEGKRKIILEVLKSRLGLGWPYNYRALDILSNLDPTYLIGMLDDISKFASPAAGVFGGEQLKLVTNTFIDKVKAAKKKKEDDELAKKHAEMMAMWGPLFTNEPAKPVYPAHLFFPHTASRPVPYPYVPPGLNCPPVTWANTAPEGWTSWVTPEARGVPKCCMPPW